MVNSITFFQRVKLTDQRHGQGLDRMAVGLRSARLPSLRTVIGLPATSLAHLMTYVNYAAMII